jgi:hypothetical protein
MNREIDKAYTEAAAAELRLRFALAAGAELNDVASQIEQDAEVTRRESRWESEDQRERFYAQR